MLLHDDADLGHPTSDVAGPFGVSKSSKTPSHGFVEAVRRDLDSVLDAIDVATRHSCEFRTCSTRARPHGENVGMQRQFKQVAKFIGKASDSACASAPLHTQTHVSVRGAEQVEDVATKDLFCESAPLAQLDRAQDS
jgi:hypothetical protein